MRMSRLFLRTLRDDPADAEIDSHRLLVRAGYIRRLSAGIYTWLPLGQRVLANVARIVREEMDGAGAQEITMPIAQPRELWERTGRDEAYGPLMFRLEDRREVGFCLSPTAEEVVTALVAGEYSSYRDLPVNLYQINWKYRDELRPRFGLLRGREFLMKDAYSFDRDREGLGESYRAMYEAYQRVFERCGLTVRAVEAQAGEIGGDVNHEFMAVAAVGEDDFVWCRSCDYAANVEAATRAAPPGPSSGDSTASSGDSTASSGDSTASSGDAPPLDEIHTPGATSIDAVAAMLEVEPQALLKSIAFDVDGALGLALVPGDREVNEHGLAAALAPRPVRLLTDEDFAARPGLPRGYLGPHHPDVAVVVADHGVAARPDWVTGANRPDHHVRHAALGRDFTVDVWADLVTVASGDPCPRCGSELSVDRGIEVGHVFQLGTKYAEALGAHYRDDAGAEHPMVMGCYGIGVSRLVAAVAEEHHDEGGLCWPAALAPYRVHVVVLPGRGDAAEAVVDAADALVAALEAGGTPVLVDDREVSPGVKFADADLLGIPVQITVGAKGLGRGVVERKVRATGARDELAVADAAAALGG